MRVLTQLKREYAHSPRAGFPDGIRARRTSANRMYQPVLWPFTAKPGTNADRFVMLVNLIRFAHRGVAPHVLGSEAFEITCAPESVQRPDSPPFAL